MAQKFFLSHYSGDKEVAEIIAGLLTRISLKQIEVWYSSDGSENSGLKPGQLWFNEILAKISQSKSVVVILTPNSISKPWIYYESGIAESIVDCEVVPICVGIDRDSIKPPLSLYQCYQTTDYKSLKELIAKLLMKYSIVFDEEICRPFIEKAVSAFSRAKFDIDTKDSSLNVLEELKKHIDNRFVDLMDKFFSPTTRPRESFENTPIIEIPDELPIYSFKVKFDFPDFEDEIFLDLRESDTFQDVTNSLFLNLDSRVEPFSYLKEWTLFEKESKKNAIIKEVASLIPAKLIFKPNSLWIAKKLFKPYDVEESISRMMI